MSKKLFKIIPIVLVSILLCQCTKSATFYGAKSTVARKQAAHPYTMPTAEYIARAKAQDGVEKQNALILAAGRLITEGQWQRGMAILAQTRGLTPDQANEKNLLMAQVDLMRDNSKSALAKLAAVKASENLSDYYQIQYHELLAQTYRAQGKFNESIAERIKLSALLTDTASEWDNERTLWLTLANMPQAELDMLAMESPSGSELQGWLELARISRNHHDNSKSLLTALEQWQIQHNTHPANKLLPKPLDGIVNALFSQPEKIALLLPFSGSLSGPGSAIHDGFMQAYQGNNARDRIKLQVYDTDKGNVAEIYQQALNDGADYVIGPLTKSHVSTIAAMNHPVPTLLLNDSEIKAKSNSYFFGLSPTYEAAQVAIKARSKGYNKALVIAPQNDWGSEVANAFSSEWQEQGGKVVDTFSYSAKEDLNKGMRDFLRITDSEQREKEIKELLGRKVETSINRRQDFDVVFLLAYPSKARQIMPLLKYYYAGDVPVFATSSVYAGNVNALKDRDLDGLIFCDMPWMFANQVGNKNWPEQFNSYNRLYALGMDSFALATQLNQLMIFPANESESTKGVFYLKPTKQVARILQWGQFRQGLAQPLSRSFG